MLNYQLMKLSAKLFVFSALVLLSACGREFLEIKRSRGQVVPNSVADFQAILDRSQDMNRSSSHELSVIGADEYDVADNQWESLRDPYQKNGYIWNADVYEHQDVDDWNSAYFRILIANMVLEGAAGIVPSAAERAAWNNIRGSALFFRAWNHYQLAQLFCKPYDPQTASTEKGIPLRLESDVTLKMGRGSLEGVYRQIIGDLREASDLLPVEPANKMRSSKPAVLALLARVFLMMGDYEQAGQTANRCLELTDELVDFNGLDLTTTQLFLLDYGETNPEMLFYSVMDNITITNTSRFHADTTLLSMYDVGDLRAPGYFRDAGGGRMVFKASYGGSVTFFTGLATDEVYLIASECAARNGNTADALRYLNTLLSNRYEPSLYQPVALADPNELLKVILRERRKELVLRGVRWEDLRRLNKDPEHATTLTRVVNGVAHTLEPGSPRWVWPIPDKEVDIGDLPQNER